MASDTREREKSRAPGHQFVLGELPWDEIDERVTREQRNREVFVPAISMYRWWARRPHALIGSLIARASSLGATTVSDPFSGGGTVAIEAARAGMTAYAQDLHPWAIAGLRHALDRPDLTELRNAVELVEGELKRLDREYYATTCPQHGGAFIVAAFWVRQCACPDCGKINHAFPYGMVSRASRRADERDGYFGCQACGHINLAPHSRKRVRCSSCTHQIRNEALNPDRRATCWSCRSEFQVLDGSKPTWRCVMVQRSCTDENGKPLVHYASPTPSELESLPRRRDPIPAALKERIPLGIETRVLHRAGFERWAELYPPRQFNALLAVIRFIHELRVSATVRSRLLLAVCGAAEMAGFASRWDRCYPKAFEAIANHRYGVPGFSCETNLLGTRGRGTIRRRLEASVRAAAWAQRELSSTETRYRAGSGARMPLDKHLLVRGSSSRQLLADHEVDLVLTDPPYFDDVQYGELAALFLAWARASDLVRADTTMDLSQEAVVNSQRGTTVERYREMLTEILAESHRTLKQTGRLVITFHNTDLRAWWALAGALREASFWVAALAVARAENDADHSKRPSGSFLHDLVIECSPTPLEYAPEICRTPTTDEQVELIGAGNVVAVGGSLDFEQFRAKFADLTSDVTTRRIRLPKTIGSS